jgi:hypothetical protein
MKNTSYALALMVLAACSSKPPEKKPIIYPNEAPEVSTTKPKKTSITAQQVAAEQGTNIVAEVRFKKHHAKLPRPEKDKIKVAFEKAKLKGEIVEVQLITWADQDLPSEKKGELTKKQKELAEKRNDYLEDLVEDLDGDLKIKKIGMAEQAGFLAKFTATEEAQVKETLDPKQAPGKASEAMIVFMLKK